MEKLKRLGTDKLIMLGLFGVLLMVVILPGSHSEKEKSPLLNTGYKEVAEEESEEEKLKSMLEACYGVGNVEVYITSEPRTEYAFGMEENESKQGILILLRSLDFETTAYDLTGKLAALYGLPEYKIVVMRMK